MAYSYEIKCDGNYITTADADASYPVNWNVYTFIVLMELAYYERNISTFPFVRDVIFTIARIKQM